MKGIFGRIAAAAQARTAGVPSYGMIPPLGSVQTSSGLLVSQATAMGVSTVYACVRRIATDMARCTPYLYRLNDDGSKEKVTDHPVAELFKRPNQQQTWFEWAFQTWVGHELRGNGYAACKRDRKGNPLQLIAVNPDAVMVLEAADGSIFYNVNRIGLWQIAMLAEFPVAIAQEDFFHLRGLTFNSLVGISTIGLSRDAIGLAMGLEQQGSRWLANGAKPSFALKTGRLLSEPAAKRLKQQVDENHAGIQNYGKTMIFEEGLEPVPLQMSGVDLQYIPQRANQVLEVCRFFGVPPHKVGVMDRGSSQNIAQQDQDYVNTTIMQRVQLFEEKFAAFFDLDEEDIYVGLDQTQLLRADVMTRANASRLNILSGKTTQNEERKADGLPALKGGDVLLRPSNMAASGSDLTGAAADGAGKPQSGTISDASAGTGGTPNTEQETASEDESPDDIAPQN